MKTKSGFLHFFLFEINLFLVCLFLSFFLCLVGWLVVVGGGGGGAGDGCCCSCFSHSSFKRYFQGDSGGPLFCVHEDVAGRARHTQYGLVSWGEGCALAGSPGFYTYLPFFSRWLHAVALPVLGNPLHSSLCLLLFLWQSSAFFSLSPPLSLVILCILLFVSSFSGNHLNSSLRLLPFLW